MPKYCAAFGCTSSSFNCSVDEKTLSFHKFPLNNKKLLNIWLWKLKRENFVPSKYSVICSDHFEEDCFEYQNISSRRFLKKDAIPTKFSFTHGNERKRTPYMFGEKNMEYINCFVPGCKSKCPKETESSFFLGEQIIHMFPAPRADRIFEKWMRIFLKMGEKFSRDDHVCELHFREDEIERFYITKTSDGSVIEIEKRKPSLKSGTIPTLFLDSHVDITKDSSKRLLDTQNSLNSSPKKRKVDKSSISSAQSNESDDETLSIILDNSTISLVDLTEESHSPIKENFTYQKLLQNVTLVKKPNKYWSVACTDNFIIFARWNEKYHVEKRIVVENSNCIIIRAFLKELEINITDLMDITCIDDISTLLEKVESYKMNFTC